MSHRMFKVTAVQIFYQNSILVTETHVHMKASSATKQHVFCIK